MTPHIHLALSPAAALGVLAACVALASCGKDTVPYDTKYLPEFHALSLHTERVLLSGGGPALYVDYSNCIARGMDSPVYQKMVSPLTAAAKEYWSIKGDSITLEKGDTYELLNNVTEVDYAALDEAIDRMAKRHTESVLLTDGELFTQTATKNNPNNPYMHRAFKEWLLRGHDIHLIAEPYVETYRGKRFDKKRFYIIFTDDRMEGNIYSRIKDIVDLEDFPEVDEFHLSGNYPWAVPADGNASAPHEILGAVVKPCGTYEIQDWQVNWKNILDVAAYGYDIKGDPLPYGEKVIGGLRVNKDAFGCYRIKDIDVTVTNINDEYFALYSAIEAGEQAGAIDRPGPPIEHFLIADRDRYRKDGAVDLYFDVPNFAPDGDLTGRPYNYFRIDIRVKELENILDDSIDILNFDSVINEGQTNISISESLKNCAFDPDLVHMLDHKVLYSIYVKSDKY